MRYGTNVNGEISIDSSLPYDEELLPHWKEFASALEQYQCHLESSDYDGESKLTFFDIVLSAEVINLLSKALRLKLLKYFVVWCASLRRSYQSYIESP